MSRAGDAIERLTSLVEQDRDDDVRATTFARGLVLGALVGAAVAGSTIWQRRHRAAPIEATDEASDAAVAPLQRS